MLCWGSETPVLYVHLVCNNEEIFNSGGEAYNKRCISELTHERLHKVSCKRNTYNFWLYLCKKGRFSASLKLECGCLVSTSSPPLPPLSTAGLLGNFVAIWVWLLVELPLPVMSLLQFLWIRIKSAANFRVIDCRLNKRRGFSSFCSLQGSLVFAKQFQENNGQLLLMGNFWIMFAEALSNRNT